ncbi:chemotaxis protein CheW [Thermosyntropha lipolytica]|uniref:chemotaxis protein CheW n=1 Tax=Thermosyntropha lipolytica TaxID=54294 RepID=UPI0009354FA9|nr:chemotaxis protein CheW [Thermosyntropha lipolytica]
MAEKQFVVFKLGDEYYGFDILNIQEITRYQKPTLLPNMPDYMEGIINLRGNIIPVINLRKKFNMHEGQVTEESRIIVADVHQQKIGILVDAVSRVAKINEEEIEAYQETDLDYKARYISGLAKKENEIIILLNPYILIGESQTAVGV